MSVHEKINMREYAYFYLEINQYLQLIKLNLLCMVPYYQDRLNRQFKEVEENERFRSVFGCYRVEYENN